MSDASHADRHAGDREYLFDMLAQLAGLARGCGEERVARVLEALVITQAEQRQLPDESVVIKASTAASK